MTLYKKLEEVDDQLAHPQKHILTRKMVELLVIRLLEIRQSLVITENSEFFYFDELCYTEKIPLPEFEWAVPSFYYHDPPPFVFHREGWFLSLAEKAKREAEAAEEERKRMEAMMRSENPNFEDEYRRSAQEADQYSEQEQQDFINIQTMERARQGRIRFIMARYVFQEEFSMYHKEKKNKESGPLMEMEKAVIIIQVRGTLSYYLVIDI